MGVLKVNAPELGKVVSDFGTPVATLNYDNLIEQAAGRSTVGWKDRERVTRALRALTPGPVVHLHGFFDNPESVVFGGSSYSAVAKDPHSAAILLTMARTMVFVGCGATFEDPNFTRLIDWGKATLRDLTHRHYVLCRDQEVASFDELRQQAPWLEPLPYGTEYPELLPFDSIDWFAKILQVEQRKTRSMLLLPLMPHTLMVLRHYLAVGRPRTEYRQLFLRVRDPAGPLKHTAICDVFSRRARHIGIPLDRYSSYSLRHAFAVHLLNRGVGIKPIGDVLGHRTFESTQVYLHLETDMPRAVRFRLLARHRLGGAGPRPRRRSSAGTSWRRSPSRISAMSIAFILTCFISGSGKPLNT